MTYTPKGAPRFRVNKTTDQSITTSWQRIYFDGTSPLNVNTYSIVDDVNVVTWDNDNGVFKFNHPETERNYLLTMYLEISVSITNTRAMFQYRFVIPNGVSPGVDFYFPFPDNQPNAYADLGELTLFTSVRHRLESQPIYTNQQILDNGLGIEYRMSNNVAMGANPLLTNAVVLISSTSMT